MTFVSGQMAAIRQRMAALLVRVLQEAAAQGSAVLDCSCESALMISHPPEE
jgi:hypothetical protein